LSEGRFFVINISPVLLRRASRNQASKRIAVPFDLHRIFIEEGYDFIDDIIWLKPEGAGGQLVEDADLPPIAILSIQNCAGD
jgi:DNA modification methylase